MATNYLNRRMDLQHNAAPNLNYLTMDTSYPVKISGKILKLFTAIVRFNNMPWVLQNTEGNTILNIDTDHVFDFAGRVIKNNIGEDKAYPTLADVFNLNDYVMVIIDFDESSAESHPSIHLCSQTNFTNFITNGDGAKGNLKLFNITGDTTVEGFEYPIDTQVFEDSIDFEDESSQRYSLLRGDKDGVLYETPLIEDDKKSMTPVANINNVNINALNTSIQNFIYPFLNNASYNTKEGEDTIDSLMCYNVINGEVNDEFVEKYCYTASEVVQLPIWDKRYTKYEYNNLDNPDNYYFVLTANSNNNQYSSTICDDSVIFTPIRKSDLSFATYKILTNNGFLVNKNRVSIAAKNINSLFGTWFTNDDNAGFIYHHFTGSRAAINIYGAHARLVNQNIKSKPYYMLYNNRNSDAYYVSYEAPDVSTMFTDDDMQDTKRFIEFFGNNDGTYTNHMKNYAVNVPTDVSAGRICYKQNDIYLTTKTPQCVIVEYPEAYEHVVFDKSGSSYTHASEHIHNFNSMYNGSTELNFDRKNYKYDRRIDISDHLENLHLMYQLVDCNTTSGKCVRDNANSIKTKVNNVETDYKFRVSKSVNAKSISNFVCTPATADGNMIMVTPITKLSVATVRPPYYEDTEPDYNNAELQHQSMVLYKKVKYANEYFEIDGDGKILYYPNGISSGVFKELYIATIKASGESTTPDTGSAYFDDIIVKPASINDAFDNFKSMDSVNNNIVYLYYWDDSVSGYIYRIKYYRDATETARTIGNFDYFTVHTIAQRGTIGANTPKDSYCTYNKAYVNYIAKQNSWNINQVVAYYNGNTCPVSSSPALLVATVVSKYSFWPKSLVDSVGVYFEACNGLDSQYYSSTAALTIGVDEIIRYAIWPNTDDPNINGGYGWLLKDMPEISDKYAVYQNGQCPYVSDVIDTTSGGKVYNIYNYNKYIKARKVNEVYETVEMKYLNGAGIREEYYNNVSIYDFYKYALTHDMGKPLTDPASLLTDVSVVNKAMFTKANVGNIASCVINADNKYEFRNANNTPYTLTTANNGGITLNANINPQALFGFNRSTLEDSSNNDVTDTYVSDDHVYLVCTQTGKKTSYSIALTEGDVFSPVIPSVNGNIGNIEADTINWRNLLIALNGNKSLDILSKPMIDIKTSVNDDFINTTQNINDNVTMAKNDATETNRAAHDSKFQPSSEHYKSVNGEFDYTHNVNKFNYGYGFDSNHRRSIDERGVIVFVSNGGIVAEDTNGSSDPEDYTYRATLPEIYPKRMYINNDGLLCTKDYYDREKAEYTPSNSATPSYPSNPTCIADLLHRIEELEARVQQLET